MGAINYQFCFPLFLSEKQGNTWRTRRRHHGTKSRKDGGADGGCPAELTAVKQTPSFNSVPELISVAIHSCLSVMRHTFSQNTSLSWVWHSYKTEGSGKEFSSDLSGLSPLRGRDIQKNSEITHPQIRTKIWKRNILHYFLLFLTLEAPIGKSDLSFPSSLAVERLVTGLLKLPLC